MNKIKYALLGAPCLAFAVGSWAAPTPDVMLNHANGLEIKLPIPLYQLPEAKNGPPGSITLNYLSKGKVTPINAKLNNGWLDISTTSLPAYQPGDQLVLNKHKLSVGRLYSRLASSAGVDVINSATVSMTPTVSANATSEGQNEYYLYNNGDQTNSKGQMMAAQLPFKITYTPPPTNTSAAKQLQARNPALFNDIKTALSDPEFKLVDLNGKTIANTDFFEETSSSIQEFLPYDTTSSQQFNAFHQASLRKEVEHDGYTTKLGKTDEFYYNLAQWSSPNTLMHLCVQTADGTVNSCKDPDGTVDDSNAVIVISKNGNSNASPYRIYYEDIAADNGKGENDDDYVTHIWVGKAGSNEPSQGGINSGQPDIESDVTALVGDVKPEVYVNLGDFGYASVDNNGCSKYKNTYITGDNIDCTITYSDGSHDSSRKLHYTTGLVDMPEFIYGNQSDIFSSSDMSDNLFQSVAYADYTEYVPEWCFWMVCHDPETIHHSFGQRRTYVIPATINSISNYSDSSNGCINYNPGSSGYGDPDSIAFKLCKDGSYSAFFNEDGDSAHSLSGNLSSKASKNDLMLFSFSDLRYGWDSNNLYRGIENVSVTLYDDWGRAYTTNVPVFNDDDE